jgi:hypothetical protein
MLKLSAENSQITVALYDFKKYLDVTSVPT